MELWRLDHIQKQLNSICRKKPIWEDISSKLNTKGFSRTAKQCEVRIHILTTKYRKIVKSNKERGAAPKTCPFFDELDEVLGTKPSTSPPCLIDSGKQSPAIVLEKNNTDENACNDCAEEQDQVVSDSDDRHQTKLTTKEKHTPVKEDSTGTTSVSTVGKSEPSTSTNTDKKGKKRPQTQDFFDTFMEMQKKSEERFYDFESKRMEMEMKEEEKRQAREEQQEQRQQGFLLELAKIFAAQK